MTGVPDGAPARSGSTPAEYEDPNGIPETLLGLEDGYIPDDETPPAGAFANMAAAVVVIVFGVLATIASLNLGIGSVTRPSAGSWPFAISVVITLLGVALLFTGRRLRDAEKFTRQSPGVAIGVLALTGAALLIPIIGFEIPSFLLLFIWMKFLGGEAWRISIIISLIFTAVFYAIFLLALRVPLPHLF